MCGAVSDLHAADARYHKSCRVSFMYQKSTSAAVKGHEVESLQAVISVLNEDQTSHKSGIQLNYILGFSRRSQQYHRAASHTGCS